MTRRLLLLLATHVSCRSTFLMTLQPPQAARGCGGQRAPMLAYIERISTGSRRYVHYGKKFSDAHVGFSPAGNG